MNAPIFLLGASRSGTPTLRLMLNAHPNIAILDDQDFFSSLPVPAETWDDPPLSDSAYEHFVTTHLRRIASTLPGLDLPSVKASILQSTVSRDLRIPYEVPLYAWARAQGKQRWGETTPENIFFVDVLDDMFPEAQYIHLVRDPRGAVHSMNQFDQCSSDTVINATNWCEFIKRGAPLLEHTIPEDRRLTLTYEEVTANPGTVAERLCSFLDEPFASKMLNDPEVTTDKQPTSRTPDDNTTVRPSESNTTYHPEWVNGMSNDQIAVVESICEEEMNRYGYEPTGVPASTQARADQYLKLTYVAAKRLQHAEDRFHVINYSPFPRLRDLRPSLPQMGPLVGQTN